jgi:putative tricarboxylic transport membrane protein
VSLPALASPLRVAGLVIVLFGAWFLWEAFGLREGPGYAAVGPKTFPLIVGGGMLLAGLGVWVTGGGHREGGPSDEAEEAVHDWRTLCLFAAILALYIALFLPLGFIVSSALLVVGGAWTLGSRSWKRDLTCGVVVSLVTYVVFTSLLGLELPGGPLEAPLRLLRPGVAY